MPLLCSINGLRRETVRPRRKRLVLRLIKIANIDSAIFKITSIHKQTNKQTSHDISIRDIFIKCPQCYPK